MNNLVIKILIEKGSISAGDLTKDKTVSSYTYYNTAKELEQIGVASEKGGRLVFSDSLVAGAFKKLFFEGFDASLLTPKNVKILAVLLEPKNLNEISGEIGLSIAQTSNRINKLAQFLSKEEKKYSLSKSNPLLHEFISLTSKKNTQDYYWSKGEEKLLKLPLYFPFEGVLTGFSRFSQLGLMVNPSHSFVYLPKKELSLEEIFSHAIRFSSNANDIMLCILFYLKNKPRIDVMALEKNCEKLGILQLWLDMVAYLEEQPVKEEKMFLPRQEFLAKAETYEIKPIERFDQQTINAIFGKVEEKISEKIRVFFIGGNAMIEHKTKTSTKDVDIVVLTDKEGFSLVRAFKDNGFAEIATRELQYGQLEASTMLHKEGFPRIDLFVKKICGMLEFSGGMQKRSKQIRQGKLELYLSSLEDIFLLKSISSRDSDVVDCENILSKTTLDWKTIYKEIIAQEKNLKNGIKEMAILGHLEALEKRLGTKIPITKKILGLGLEKTIIYLAKTPISVKEALQKIDFPEITIRNKIRQLIKNKKLAKLGGRPFKVQAK